MWQILCVINQGVDDATEITFNLRSGCSNPERWVRVAMDQLGFDKEQYAIEIQVTPEDCERT